MKKRIIIVVSLLILLSVVYIAYAKITNNPSVKFEVQKIENILKQSSLSTQDEAFLNSIKDENWDIIANGKWKGKEQLHKIVVYDDVIENTLSYFEHNKNKEYKEKAIKLLNELK